MRFATLCSGIGAPEIAFESIGWNAIFCAEIEPFPCVVLKQRFPEIPNLGNVNGITREQIESFRSIDALIFGFPCQDLSVAGQRKGLTHADGTKTRSGLFFQCAKIADWIGCRWTIAENVPGLFSSNDGLDFAAVVGELAGTEIDVPRDGWRNTGVALGPKGLIEWCVLDAQWFGLAQRRKRVFIVRDSGDWSNRPPILFNAQSLRWNNPPRRETGQSTVPTINARTKGGGGLGTDAKCDGAVIPIQEIDHLGGVRNQNGSSVGRSDDPMYTLQSQAQHGFCATITKNYATHHGRTAGNNGGVAENQLVPEVCPTLLAQGNSTGGDLPPGTAVDTADSLLPEITGAVSSKWAKGSGGPSGDEAYNLVAFSSKDHGADASDNLSHTLRSCSHDESHANAGASPAIAFQTRIARNDRGQPESDIVPALSGADAGATSDMRPCVAFQPKFFTRDKASGSENENVSPPVCSAESRSRGDAVTAVQTGMQVRRLTPRECERLQGFPDDWTRIPWRGKPADQCPDGPRYRAIGNSMAVPVVKWIGQQIMRILCRV